MSRLVTPAGGQPGGVQQPRSLVVQALPAAPGLNVAHAVFAAVQPPVIERALASRIYSIAASAPTDVTLNVPAAAAAASAPAPSLSSASTATVTIAVKAAPTGPVQHRHSIILAAQYPSNDVSISVPAAQADASAPAPAVSITGRFFSVSVAGQSNQNRVTSAPAAAPVGEVKDPQPATFVYYNAAPPIYNAIVQGSTNQGFAMDKVPQPDPVFVDKPRIVRVLSTNVTISVPAAAASASASPPSISVGGNVSLDVPAASAPASAPVPVPTVSLAPPAAASAASAPVPTVTLAVVPPAASAPASSSPPVPTVALSASAASAAAAANTPVVRVALSPPAASAAASSSAPTVTIVQSVTINVGAAAASASAFPPGVAHQGIPPWLDGDIGEGTRLDGDLSVGNIDADLSIAGGIH